MSVALDSLARRQARARALAAVVMDQGPAITRFQGTLIGLKPSTRRRVHSGRSVTTPTGQLGYRGILAKSVLALQLLALMAALWLPAFRVSQISLTGDNVLSNNAVISTAAIAGQSVFTIDGNTVRSRLTALPWIRDATVSTALPNKMTIHITEWSPTLRMLHADTDVLLADDGAIVDSTFARHTALASIPILVDSRAGKQAAPSAALVQKLDQAVTRFPKVFAVSIAAFEWQVDGRFAIWTKSGWRAIIGHIDTADQVAAIGYKLSYLGALIGKLDFVSPTFGYIDLESPQTPTVGGTPGLPQTIANALTVASIPLNKPVPASHPAPAKAVVVNAAAAPAPAAPAPAATPAPTPAAPTPYSFTLSSPPPRH